MKKLASVLSVLLAAALVLVSMPIAQAAEFTLEGSGVVQRNVPANEDPAVILATVHEGTYATKSTTNDWSGPVLNGELTLFSGVTALHPGAANGATPADRYKFVLVNEYSKPIEYTYTHGPVLGPAYAVLPIDYTLYRNGALTALPAGGLTGTVPVGGYVEFELEWSWDIDDGSTTALNNGITGWELDSPIGVDSAQGVRSEYKALLQFYIEADSSGGVIWMDADGVTEYGKWEWENLLTGTTFTQAVVQGFVVPEPVKAGFKFVGWTYDQAGTQPVDLNDIIRPNEITTVYAQWEVDGVDIPWWIWILPPVIAVPLIPIIGLITGLPIVLGGLGLLGLGGFAISKIKICWLCWKPCSECTCEGKCRNPDCKTTDATKQEKPPKTGDSSTAAWSALTMLALSGGLALYLRKRREEDDE